MQMPSTGGNSTNGLIKENGGGDGTSKRIISAASKGKGMKNTNPYC